MIVVKKRTPKASKGIVQPKPYAKSEPPKAKKDAHTDGKDKSES
jgi:hypothetical protein